MLSGGLNARMTPPGFDYLWADAIIPCIFLIQIFKHSQYLREFELIFNKNSYSIGPLWLCKMTDEIEHKLKIRHLRIDDYKAAIFTPSDFSFPDDAIASQATSGIETTLITDQDLDLIKELRSQGSVRNAESRRVDLYELRRLGE